MGIMNGSMLRVYKKHMGREPEREKIQQGLFFHFFRGISVFWQKKI